MLENIEWLQDGFTTLDEARKNNRGLSLALEIIKFAAFLILIQLIMKNAVVEAFEYVLNPADDVQYFLIKIWAFGVVMLIYFVLIRVLEKRNLRSIGFTKDRWFSSYVKGLICGFIMFGIVIVLGCALGYYRFNGVKSSVTLLLVLFFFGFVVQGMEQEVYARGWVFVSIARKNSIWIAMFISSIVFSSIHIFNNSVGLLALFNIVLSGIMFVVMLLRYDNIWFCSAVHSMWNYAQGCVFGFEVSGNTGMPAFLSFTQTKTSIIAGNAFGPESGLLTTLVFTAAILFFFFYPKITKSK